MPTIAYQSAKKLNRRHACIGLLAVLLSGCAATMPPADTKTAEPAPSTPAATAAPDTAAVRRAGQPLSGLPRTVLVINGHRAEVQLAVSDIECATGLRHRTAMPENEGMLLVFPQEVVQCLWMHEAPLPLSAAFIRSDGRIVHLADMTPLTQDLHCSPEPVRYALEMNRGWFERRGIGRHSRVEQLPAFR